MENRVVYSIDVEDLQNVANEEIGRDLTQDEVSKIENKLDDYFDWYGTIQSIIDEFEINTLDN
jgi:hypothetical protein